MEMGSKGPLSIPRRQSDRSKQKGPFSIPRRQSDRNKQKGEEMDLSQNPEHRAIDTNRMGKEWISFNTQKTEQSDQH